MALYAVQVLIEETVPETRQYLDAIQRVARVMSRYAVSELEHQDSYSAGAGTTCQVTISVGELSI